MEASQPLLNEISFHDFLALEPKIGLDAMRAIIECEHGHET